MKSKDLTPIYLKAMDKIAREVEEYSCAAIAGYYNTPSRCSFTVEQAVRFYAQIFSPDGKCGNTNGPFARAVKSGPDPKGHRLAMLALAAACWRDFL